MSKGKTRSVRINADVTPEPVDPELIRLRREQIERDVLILELIEAKRRMYGNSMLYRDQEDEIVGRALQTLEPPRSMFSLPWPSLFGQ